MELRQRQPRVHNERHLKLVRQLPCLVCGRYPPSEAAHVRYRDDRYGKRSAGVGEKPDDRWTVPLCAGCHRTDNTAQHGSSERLWWEGKGIDPLALCVMLADCDTLYKMEEVFFRFRMEGHHANTGDATD